jgi:hypothetical protein
LSLDHARPSSWTIRRALRARTRLPFWSYSARAWRAASVAPDAPGGDVVRGGARLADLGELEGLVGLALIGEHVGELHRGRR